MSVTRKEMREFKQLVCNWLLKHGIDVEHLFVESHTDVDGFVICWNDKNQKHVVYNRDEWVKYIGSNSYESIRKEDLRTLRNS